MTNVVITGIVFLSLISILVLYALSKSNWMKNEKYFLLAVFACVPAVVGATALLFYRYFRRVDPAMYVFSLFCWTGLCSLAFALEMDGYISNFIGSHIVQGEPHLKTAHGTVLSYWDATAQTLLCILAIAFYCNRISHREVSLYWAGSILSSCIVLIPGALTGPHRVKAGIVPNIILYFGAPFLIAARYLHRSPIQARSFLKFPPIWRRPVDLFFALFFKLAVVVAMFRLMTVLGGNASCMKDYVKNFDPYLKDPNMFPKFQALTYGYFFVAYYVITIYGLVFPGQHWMSDWSLIHAGAAASAQFSYVAGALHHRTSKGLHPPTSGEAAFTYWIMNTLLFIVPQLFAIWCYSNPEKYGRTYTVDLAHPIKTYVVTSLSTTTTSPRKSYRKDE